MACRGQKSDDQGTCPETRMVDVGGGHTTADVTAWKAGLDQQGDPQSRYFILEAVAFQFASHTFEVAVLPTLPDPAHIYHQQLGHPRSTPANLMVDS